MNHLFNFFEFVRLQIVQPVNFIGAISVPQYVIVSFLLFIFILLFASCRDLLKASQLKNRQIFYFLVLFVVILFTRSPKSFVKPMFWAEDGWIFFAQAYNLGLKSFVTPYAGYLLTIPRIVAYIASFFPYVTAPIIYCYAALAGTTFCAWTILSKRFQLPYKVLLALSLTLLPITGESVGVLCSIQTALVPLYLFLLLAQLPTNKKQAVFDYCCLLLLSFTAPFVLIFFPLFCLKLFIQKNKHSVFLVLIALSGAITQLSLIVGSHSRLPSHFDIGMIELVVTVLFAKLIELPFLFRGELIPIEQFGLMMQLFVLILVSVCFIYFLVSIKKNKQVLFVTTYTICVTMVVVLVGGLSPLKTYLPAIAGGRYYYLPFLMIAWTLILSLEGNRFCKIIASILLVLMLLNTMVFYEYKVVSHNDYRWGHYSKMIKPDQAIRIRINPAFPGYYIILDKKK